jgi:prepilin-type N-terminal cleavage/methylation domain-containing protein
MHKNYSKLNHFTNKYLIGFTLIELLIVVAIIAILAVIAVPNFLNAQIRSKASRAKNELKTLTTGIELYKVDNNSYPIMMLMDSGNGFGIDPWLPGFPYNIPSRPGQATGNNHQMISLRIGITTPIAYLTREPEDPFCPPQNAIAYGYMGKRYFYSSAETYYLNTGIPSGTHPTDCDWHREIFGEWRICSGGPVRDCTAVRILTPFESTNLWRDSAMTYDPTNGTISNGVILRCQRFTDGSRPFYPQHVQ